MVLSPAFLILQTPDDLGTLFSASDGTDEDAWAPFYAEPHTVLIGDKPEEMDETAHLAKILTCIQEETPYPMYLYLGGEKYHITRAVSVY